MRKVLLLCSLAATPALAQPVTQPACEVRIARAPDDVRQLIEQALASERCTISLEVRVVATDGGLYLMARDDHDRVRERVVPDGKAAAVLVASWAADNALAAPAPSVVQPAPSAPAAILPPPPAAAASIDTTLAYRRPASERWVESFLTLPLGGRASLDLAAHGRWTFGGTIAASDRPLLHGDLFSSANGLSTREVTAFDARALGYVARTFGDGLWTIRTAVGAGLVYTSVHDDTYMGSGTAMESHEIRSGVFPMAEGSVLIGRDVGAGWGLDLAIVTTVLEQRIHLPGFDPFGNDITLERNVELELGLGLRHRL